MMVWLSLSSCWAQFSDHEFKKLPEELGLNNTTVTSIVQDKRGFLWFGTWVGLYRYDGHTAKLYKIQANNPNALQSNKISTLMVTKSGELYIGTLVGGAYKYRYDYDDFISLANERNNALRSSIWSLHEDKYNHIWAGTEKGIAVLDETTQKFTNKDVFLKSDINTRKVQQLADHGTDYVWAASDGGVFCFLPEKNGDISEIANYTFFYDEIIGEHSSYISSIIKSPTEEDKLLVLSKSGIVELDYSKGLKNAKTKMLYPAVGEFVFPRVIGKTSQFAGKLLVGSNSGVSLYDPKGKMQYNAYLKGNVIKCIFEDSFGTLWVGTDYGLRKFNKSNSFITTHNLTDSEIQLDVMEYLTKSPLSSDVWMAWQNGVISRMKADNPKDIRHFRIYLDGQIVGERISQLAIDDKGQVWLGTQGAGVLKFNENQVTNKNVINVVRALNKNNGLDDNYIMSVTDVADHLWIGTWNSGFYKYLKNRGEVIHYDEIEGLNFKMKEVPIVEITEVKNGKKLLLGTRGYGVIVADIEGNQLSKPFHISSNHKSNRLGNDFITDIFASGDNILICTEGGLDQFDISTNKITHLTLDNQMPKSIIQSAIVSEDNHFWLSTYNNGIFEIDKTGKKARFKNYTKDVLGNYSGSAALFLENKSILFGGAQGYSKVSVLNKEMNNMPPIPVIVDLKINNKTVSLGEEVNGSTKFDKVITALPKVHLTYKDNSFSLSINAIQTADGQSLKHAYKLEGFHEDWIYANEDEKNVYFSNLPYQNYSFRFKAGNSDGIWSEEILLPLSVAPPWYQSNLAYLLYLLCLVGVIYLLILGFLLKEQYDHQINLEKLERTKSEEVNQMKLKFYTSISHELRTPLTMIISPLEQIQSGKSTVDLQQNHQFILKNAKKLLAMVNQLLDFRKHESGTEELNLTRQDIIGFIQESFYSFASLAKDSDVNLEFINEVTALEMTFDESQIDKLINNLVSNAIKYTPRGGSIRLITKFDPSQNQFHFSVADNGFGIYEEDLQKIFDRFYQGKEHVQSGYGLGLAIVQSIVELHHGKINVESKRGVGTTFHVTLPLGLEEIRGNVQHPSRDEYEDIDLFAAPNEPVEVNSEALKYENDGRRKLLIVEDNAEIRSYLKQNFFDQFEILEAGDGVCGLELAIKEIPDIIISDIAMPKMDGLELCKEIKTNMATSHIPVVLLTARTSVEYKLNGYEFGANAYITKPFNMDILKQRVMNLLAYTDIIKQKYGKPGSKITYVYEPESPAEQSLDEEFMKKLTHIIEENLAEASFTVDDMAKLLLMSRIQIYRKVKALTGQTPNNFLREIRLKRASQLLELTDYSISEITYKVGFNDLKYFREKFKEEFGINPSDFRQANKLANNN